MVSVGSVSRIPATDIEDIIVKSVNEHLGAFFIFGPGRERANLILSMRARLRIDE